MNKEVNVISIDLLFAMFRNSSLTVKAVSEVILN